MTRKEIIKEYINTLTHTYNYNPWYSRTDYTIWLDVTYNAIRGNYVCFTEEEMKTETYWLDTMLKQKYISQTNYHNCKELIKVSSLQDLHFITHIFNEQTEISNIYIPPTKSIDRIKREFFKTVRCYESRPETYLDLLLCGEDNITKRYTYSLPLIHYCTANKLT